VLVYRRSPQGVYREENSGFAREQKRVTSGRLAREHPTWFLWQPPGQPAELRYVLQPTQNGPITWAGFALSTALTRMLGPLTRNLNVHIAVDGHEIYSGGPAPAGNGQQQWATQHANVLGLTWSFTIGSGNSPNYQTWIAGLPLIAGVLLGCLLAITIYLWQASREGSRVIERLNADLESRVRELGVAREELQQKNRKLAGETQRAEQANQAKTDFLAHMSHEIRTPLYGVIGLTELVADGPLNEAKRPELTTALVSARSLLGIVNDVLDLAKIEAGQLTVSAAPFDLRNTLQQIMDMYGPQAAANSTDLHLTYPQTAPRWFAGDEMRVRQIVANFTSNAVKFTEGGEIELGVTPDAAGVRIWVRDTGIGIDPETLPRLFSKFTQADVVSAQQYGGTGLGLAIVKQLAELMGGRVGVTSSTEQGSTFWVELPLQPTAPANVTVRDGDDSRDLAGMRVLVAEDNAVNRHLLVRLLEKHGLVADVAANGREAVARHAQADYAVVLMDCQMPVMDGYDAARAIRRQEQGTSRHTPIIAITANVLSRERDRCQAAGMDGYLTKPVQPAELVECLKQHCVANGHAHQATEASPALRN
jgi:signal transduction histidine kinase/ActR/RegA family two-component response regulator